MLGNPFLALVFFFPVVAGGMFNPAARELFFHAG